MRKLSDIRGVDAMNITADVVSIGNIILKDKDLKKYFFGKKPQGKDRTEWNNDYAADIIQAMMSRHQKEYIKLAAEIEGVPEQEYLANLTTLKALQDLNELMSDSDFKDLFFSCSPRKKTSSGSASENTEDQKE